MASWKNGKLEKWYEAKVTNRPNGTVTKWEIDKMASPKMANI